MQQCVKIYFIFMRSSTCFGRHTARHQEPKTALAASAFECVEGCWTCSPHDHRQELNNCSSNLWFYLRSVVIAVLLVVVGPPRPTALL